MLSVTRTILSGRRFHPTLSFTNGKKVPISMKQRLVSSFEQRNLKLQALNLFRHSQYSTSTIASKETMEFQAETRKLLDIVTNSIYTDKEVFLRELISNASDALEKYRYLQSAGSVLAATDSSPLEINIFTDETNCTLTLSDNGIGMTREEMISNLGTIARSGSKQFVEQQKTSEGSTDGIIGQFGVGFYSSFMVAESVSVESLSAVASESNTQIPSRWNSDGSGVFTVEDIDNSGSEAPVLSHGSRIVMKLKPDNKEFVDPEKIKSIIKRYSSFVAFPLRLNGELVNTVGAIWTMDKKDVAEAQYDEFYKFIANAHDSPSYRLHFKTDAPLDLKCLFYIPTYNTEKFGMGRLDPGVNLYSRKVLIESKPKDLLPSWLRFVKGVVDSEDLPLSLSREKPQDSRLLARINDVLTRKLLRFLDDELRKNRKSYQNFYAEFSMYLKEGLCQQYALMDQLSKLLLFESSLQVEGKLVTLDEYISRCPPEQKQIYYLVAPNRATALKSPYYETFKKHNKEVLLLYNTVDDFVMNNIKTYEGRTLISAETSTIDLKDEKEGGDKDEKKEDEAKEDGQEAKLSDEQAQKLCTWLRSSLGSKKVKEVKVSKRLSDSPAIVTDHESGALRRMMKLVEQSNAGRVGEGADFLPPQVLEVNVGHPLLVSLYHSRSSPISHLVAAQLLDNALVAAGLVEDARHMLPRLNEILLSAIKAEETSTTSTDDDDDTSETSTTSVDEVAGSSSSDSSSTGTTSSTSSTN